MQAMRRQIDRLTSLLEMYGPSQNKHILLNIYFYINLMIYIFLFIDMQINFHGIKAFYDAIKKIAFIDIC